MKDDRKKISAYEAKRQKAITDLETRYREQSQQIKRDHTKKIGDTRASLIQFLGIGEDRNGLQELERKGSSLSLWPIQVKSLLGLEKRHEAKISALKSQLAEKEERLAQKLTLLENDFLKDLQTLEHSWNRDIQDLSKRLEQWQPNKGSKVQSLDAHSRDQNAKRSIDWHTDGPGLRR